MNPGAVLRALHDPSFNSERNDASGDLIILAWKAGMYDKVALMAAEVATESHEEQQAENEGKSARMRSKFPCEGASRKQGGNRGRRVGARHVTDAVIQRAERHSIICS